MAIWKGSHNPRSWTYMDLRSLYLLTTYKSWDDPPSSGQWHSPKSFTPGRNLISIAAGNGSGSIYLGSNFKGQLGVPLTVGRSVISVVEWWALGLGGGVRCFLFLLPLFLGVLFSLLFVQVWEELASGEWYVDTWWPYQDLCMAFLCMIC